MDAFASPLRAQRLASMLRSTPTSIWWITLRPKSGDLEHAKAMGHALCFAKDLLYDCGMVSWKVRAMIQSAETSINAAKKHSIFLIQYAAKTIPKLLQCLALQLTIDYYLDGYNNKHLEDSKVINPTLYHRDFLSCYSSNCFEFVEFVCIYFHLAGISHNILRGWGGISFSTVLSKPSLSFKSMPNIEKLPDLFERCPFENYDLKRCLDISWIMVSGFQLQYFYDQFELSLTGFQMKLLMLNPKMAISMVEKCNHIFTIIRCIFIEEFFEKPFEESQWEP
ncbi:hypothetical protein HPP92_010173 [Vanilla planifolia]|uniref:Uncharacterized protein n=1 Tax=Vanilla planifolia TaxID=51239 RepID=A0A835QTD8_VANPL|nr:hypothetical protein HPP92_010173 [Vanilla planifolia]